MIVARTAEGSNVAGTVWHGPVHPEIFSREGRFLRVRRIRFAVLMMAAWLSIISTSRSSAARPDRGAVASAAYRAASRMRDERIDRVQDFSAKRGVVHSEVMLPEGAPEHLGDRERLWNDVEAFEVRKDAQLAREVEFAIREIDTGAGHRACPRLRAGRICRSGHDRGPQCALGHRRGRDAEASCPCHADHAQRGRERFRPEGAQLEPHGNGRALAGTLGRTCQRAAAELDIDARIDHQPSRRAQGIGLEPQSQIGAPAQRIEGEGLDVADRAELHREIARNNGDRIIADPPSVALDAITQQQSTFTRRDMAMFAHRHSDGIEQYNEVMGAMRNAPDLVELGQDGRDDDRFTTRDMISGTAPAPHRRDDGRKGRHEVSGRDREAALARAGLGVALSCRASRRRRWRMSRTGAILALLSAMRDGQERHAGCRARGLGGGRL